MKHATLGALALLTLGLVSAAGAQQAQPGQPATKGPRTVLRNRAPVAKELLQVRFPRPQEFRLANGVRVFVLEDRRLPVVQLSLRLRAGSLFEPKPGVADLTASTLNEGTRTRTAAQLAREVEETGGDLYASAAEELVTVSASGLAEYTDRLVELLADVLLHPSFPEDRLALMKSQTAAALTQARTDPNTLARELSTRTLYGATPYGRVAPQPEEVRALTRADLVGFHERYYRPDGAILGVSGDVDAGALVKQLEAALAGWKPRGQVVELPRSEFAPRAAARIYLIDRPGSVQTLLHFGNLGIPRTHPDYAALAVANRILGGSFTSRLDQNLREDKGYTYGARSSVITPRWPGVWVASASVRTPVTEPAVGEFFKEFCRLQEEPVSPTELDRAKRALIGSFALTLESPAGILNRALELVEHGLPADYWDTYPQQIQSVTAADVQRVARQYLSPERLQLFAVGERSSIEAGLKKYGPVEVQDAEGVPASR